MRTFYHDLAPSEKAVESAVGDGVVDDEDVKHCAVKLNSRQLVRSLNFANMQSESTMCCITEGQAMQLHVHLWGDIGDISYVIPVLNDPDEQQAYDE